MLKAPCYSILKLNQLCADSFQGLVRAKKVYVIIYNGHR